MRSRLAAAVLSFMLCASLSLAPARAEDAAGTGQGWGLQQLMLGLQQVKAASGQFVERKSLHMLQEPLVSSGTLLYVAPDQLQKITVSPQRERLAVNGDRLVIEGGPDNLNRTLSLSDNPEIAAFVEAIRATLAGDLPTLTRFYSVQLAGNAAGWQLRLEPKDAKVKELVSSIRISGSGGVVRHIETQEGDGDRSEMNIDETVQ